MENTRINEDRVINYNTCTNNLSNTYIMEEECIICYNTINEWPNVSDIEVARKMLYYNLKNQSCGCIYEIHFECIIYWLLNNPCCPMCRRSVDINNANSPINIHKDHNKVNISIGDNFDGDVYGTNTDDIVVDLEHCNYFEYINSSDENINNYSEHVAVHNDLAMAQNDPSNRRCVTNSYRAICYIVSIFIVTLAIYSFITIFM